MMSAVIHFDFHRTAAERFCHTGGFLTNVCFNQTQKLLSFHFLLSLKGRIPARLSAANRLFICSRQVIVLYINISAGN